MQFLQEIWNSHQTDILRFVKVILQCFAVFVLVKIAFRLIDPLFKIVSPKLEFLDHSILTLSRRCAKIMISLVALIMILELCGFNTTGILTVLGSAGLAVGLALKDSLSNAASGILIFVQKPYHTEDFIESGSFSGTVKEISLLNTVLKMPDGVFLSLPNRMILENPLRNCTRNPVRRGEVSVGISYGDSLPKALSVLQSFLSKNELILQDPAPQVLVADLADSSVKLTLYFWMNSADYAKVCRAVREQLKTVVEEAGLDIPFPQCVITFAGPQPQLPDQK